MYIYIYILKIVSLYISWYIVALISLDSLGWLLTPGNPPALSPEYWDQMDIAPSHNWELSPELSSLMLQELLMKSNPFRIDEVTKISEPGKMVHV